MAEPELDPPAGAAGAGARPAGPVCPVAFCPVGMALTLADQVRPEVVEHLLAAGRELLLAVKAVIDSRAESAGGRGPDPLERIDIG